MNMATTDEVSTSAATEFGVRSATHRSAGAHAMAVHEPFTATLCASAGSYAATETGGRR